MKLVTFKKRMAPDAGAAPGVLIERTGLVLDLRKAAAEAGQAPIASMNALIEEGDEGIARVAALAARYENGAAGELLAASIDIELLAPFKPIQMRCFSVYPRHLQNSVRQVVIHRYGKLAARIVLRLLQRAKPRKAPLYYKGAVMHVVGPDAPIIRPVYGEQLDYELELGVVIGKGGRNIPAANALDHVFGYTLFNDVSARGQLQRDLGGLGHAGPAKGKDFDNSNIIGPWIVTRDEVPDPQKLQGIVRVNGQVEGRGSTAEMAFSVAEEIAFISRGETIYPGEFFGTGAMADCCGIEHWRFLNDGDVVELEIPGLGLLTNKVVADSRSLETA